MDKNTDLKKITFFKRFSFNSNKRPFVFIGFEISFDYYQANLYLTLFKREFGISYIHRLSDISKKHVWSWELWTI